MDGILILITTNIKNASKQDMKAKLLKKVRKKVKLYKRNNLYYVYIGTDVETFRNYDVAMRYYSTWICRNAKDIFGLKMKTRLK